MVSVRKESTYTYEQIKEQEKPQIDKNKKKQKNYRFAKFVVVAVIAIAFSCSILILTRFMAIAETKYKVSSLEKQLSQLEVEKVKLRIDVEKVSKSGWIETEARTRLQMDYPTPEQIVRINVNPAKVAVLTNEVNQLKNNNPIKKQESKGLYTFFGRLIGSIRI